MKHLALLFLCFFAIGQPATAQQSDYALKKGFEERYKFIASRIDSSATTAELDSLKEAMRKLEADFAPHQAFLDRALYPVTFAESMEKLHALRVLTYDRIYLIRTQGVRLIDLEARITSLTARLDSLTAQRDQLFGDLQESKRSLASLRETVRKLTATLQAKDRLIFAIVDSIFLPYGKDLNHVADVQKEAISRKLEKANVVTRVYEIAADNVKFLDVTQLQARDYGTIIDQYQAFASRWAGLKDKMTEVAATSALVQPEAAAKGSPGLPSARRTAREIKSVKESAAAQAGHVDSVLAEWHVRLNTAFWGGLQKEFASAGAAVPPFKDGPSFSAGIRKYVATLKASSEDPSSFADGVWTQRIDREWRDGLSRESMLGKAEYAALDRLVSELSKETFDFTFVAYVLCIAVIVAAIWFFLLRKKKPQGAGAA